MNNSTQTIRTLLILTSLVIATAVSGCTASSDSPEVTLEKANILADRGQYDDAIPVYTKAIEAFPDRADVYYKRGICYENLKLHGRALEDYASCLQLDPENTDAINNKGVVLAQIGKFEEAALEFSLLVNQFPDNVLARRNRGLCQHDLGKFDEAIVDYNMAIELDAEDPHSWFQLGNVFLEQNKLAEAVSNYDKAIELDADYAKAWMNRGVAKYNLGQKKEALDDLQQARRLNDNIVIPGIDWAETTPASDVVVVARPAIPADADADWNSCLAFAKRELLDRNFTEVSVASAFPDQRCGLLDAIKDGQRQQVYIGVTNAGDSTHIALPAVTGPDPATSRCLLVMEFTKTAGDEASESFTVRSFVEDWRLLGQTATPILINVELLSE